MWRLGRRCVPVFSVLMRDARKTDLPNGKVFKKLAIALHYSATNGEKLSLPFSIEGIDPLTMGCYIPENQRRNQKSEQCLLTIE